MQEVGVARDDQGLPAVRQSAPLDVLAATGRQVARIARARRHRVAVDVPDSELGHVRRRPLDRGMRPVEGHEHQTAGGAAGDSCQAGRPCRARVRLAFPATGPLARLVLERQPPVDPVDGGGQVQKLWPHLDAIVRRAEEELAAFETCLDEAGADLTDIRTRRVGLAAADTWPDLDLPCLAPEIDVLGDGLRRETRTMHWSACEGLESEYEGLVAYQATLSRLRRLFVGRRSTGVIDQLAASAVRNLPDPCGTLRALGRHDDIRLEAGLRLRWSEGRVQSDGDGFQGLSWSGRVLSFPGTTPPETALTAMVGRPVTDMCRHPLLAEEMTVARAWNEAVDGAATGILKVEIASVDRLFSAARATVDPQPFKVDEALADHDN